MNTFTNRLNHALESQLYELSVSHVTECERLKSAIKTCSKAMGILKRYVINYFFESMEDEVQFFKEIKPLFYSKYIYYIQVYNFHTKKPTGSKEVLKDYISLELADLKRFFDHNQAFYQYYRTNGFHFDTIYYTRGNFDVFFELEDFKCDEMFSTSHDYKLSKIIANEKFQEYLIGQGNSLDSVLIPSDSPITWTRNQTDLVELIYALAESGAINNGNIEIKNLMDYFQNIFQVDLKRYYNKYYDISNRKKERTPFLDKLKCCLNKRIEEKFE